MPFLLCIVAFNIHKMDDDDDDFIQPSGETLSGQCGASFFAIGRQMCNMARISPRKGELPDWESKNGFFYGAADWVSFCSGV